MRKIQTLAPQKRNQIIFNPEYGLMLVFGNPSIAIPAASSSEVANQPLLPVAPELPDTTVNKVMLLEPEVKDIASNTLIS